MVALMAACNDQAEDKLRSDSKGWEDLPTLEIVRAGEAVSENEPPTVAVIDKNGMTSIIIPVPPTFLNSGGVEANARRPNQGAKEILERAGVEFPSGAYARYDPGYSQLTVYNTPDHIDLVRAYTESIGPGPSKLLTCRVEIYEMPTQAAAKLHGIAAQKVFHEAERNAVIAACRTGDATFVTGVDLPALSGQRSKFESAREYPVVSKFQPKSKSETETGPESPEALFNWKRSGLVLEIDPILGADQFTFEMDLRLSFELAPPQTESLRLVTENENSDALTISSRRFSHLELETQVHLFDGIPNLVGTFPLPPTQNDEDHDFLSAQSQVVFVQLFVRSR